MLVLFPAFETFRGRCSHNIQEIEYLTELAGSSTISVEAKQYQMNIISFLRLHRAVGWGISAVATRHFEKLTKYAVRPSVVQRD